MMAYMVFTTSKEHGTITRGMAMVSTYQQFTLTASLVERKDHNWFWDLRVTEYFNGYKHGKATVYER